MTIYKLKRIRLSKHFTAYELFYSKDFKEITISSNAKLRGIQLFLARTLCQNVLEPIREYFNKPIIITGPARNEVTYRKMLEENDIPPSKTSDHFFMNIYPFTVGAADFFVMDTDMEFVFRYMIKNLDPNVYGQIIYYPGHGFIHVSNNRNVIGKIGDLVPHKKRIMIYRNKRYEEYTK